MSSASLWGTPKVSQRRRARARKCSVTALRKSRYALASPAIAARIHAAHSSSRDRSFTRLTPLRILLRLCYRHRHHLSATGRKRSLSERAIRIEVRYWALSHLPDLLPITGL